MSMMVTMEYGSVRLNAVVKALGMIITTFRGVRPDGTKNLRHENLTFIAPRFTRWISPFDQMTDGAHWEAERTKLAHNHFSMQEKLKS